MIKYFEMGEVTWVSLSEITSTLVKGRLRKIYLEHKVMRETGWRNVLLRWRKGPQAKDTVSH